MRSINPKHIQDLLSLINKGPFFQLLNIKICELKCGYSYIMVKLEEKHLNPFGTIHGGVYASIIDTAAYWAAYCEVDEHAGYTSIDVSIHNLSMVNRGNIVVEGRSLKVGRSLCLCEAQAIDENGRLLAYGTSKLMMLKGKQSINHVIAAMGGDVLPPKFIDDTGN